MKTIVIIPYRNRLKHLLYYIKHTAPLLKKHIPDLEIIVVEQNKKINLFNKGKLINIGFHYYNNLEYNYIMNDVDTNPIHLDVIKKYKDPVKNNVIQGIYNHNICLGGIFKFNGFTYKKSNGCPNNFWGWGYEDTCFQQRIELLKIKINRFKKPNDKDINKYFKIFNDIDDRNKKNHDIRIKLGKNVMKSKNNKIKVKYILFSGLNTLKYKINKTIKINDYITLINVAL
tara:strand:- start:61 stop:747 length:687 start_codon:yes stop_codon:yes gene_type:complete